MTAEDEAYVHYADCCESLNRSWRILQELRCSDANGVVRDAAFRFALIEYAKPYTPSNGVHKSRRDAYRLSAPTLSAEDTALHTDIMNRRNQVLAHTDLTLKEAVLSVGCFSGLPSACIAQNIPDALPGLDAVIRLIENTLTFMYHEKDRLLARLAPNV